MPADAPGRLIASIILTAVGAGLVGECLGDASSVGEPLANGWRYLRMAEYDLAIASFERAAASKDEGSDGYLQALYGRATTLRMQHPEDRDAPAGPRGQGTLACPARKGALAPT